MRELVLMMTSSDFTKTLHSLLDVLRAHSSATMTDVRTGETAVLYDAAEAAAAEVAGVDRSTLFHLPVRRRRRRRRRRKRAMHTTPDARAKDEFIRPRFFLCTFSFFCHPLSNF